MKYYKIDTREYNWHHTRWRPYTFGIRMDSSTTGYAIDNLVIDLHNTRRLNAVRIDGKTPDILSRDMRFKYYSDRVQEHGVEMVMELPDHFPWKKHDSIKRIEEALDWIKQNVKCKWSLRVGRLLKKKKLFVKFSFEDISTAVMFRLTF